jgi:hypothetical protein
MSYMSFEAVLKQNLGKRCMISYLENNRPHSLIGVVKDIYDGDVVMVCSDYNITSWLRVDSIVKIKEVK